MTDYDIIIIGTGAGGGTLAHSLATTGKKILILERGGYVPREKENWSSKAVFVENRYTADDKWYDRDGNKFQAGIHYCVGGNTKFYGSALFRLRERDFEELQHEGGVSPAWPISYADLRPYYTEAETLYSVHGQRGSDPTEPPESAPYPLPPVPQEARLQQLYDGLVKEGVGVFPLPLGVRPPENPADPLILDRFDGYPDPTGTKADAHVCAINEAIRHPNVTLLTHCMVERLGTDETGKRVNVVHAISGAGTALELHADIVVVSCGAVNSAALLLRSTSASHPAGLANGSGLVGRNYMAHNSSVMMALSLEHNPTRFGKTIGINDFYFGDEAFPFPMGGIQMVGQSDKWNIKAEAPFPVPAFPLQPIAEHGLDFWLTSEDLPNPRNRVTLREDGGIELAYHTNNLKAHQELRDRLEALVGKLGMATHFHHHHLYVNKDIPLSGTAHQVGTARFGTDPRTSVLNTDCRAHEVDNLYVVDGSFFPSIGAVNPSLTIAAMALRVGEHLRERLVGTRRLQQLSI